MSTLPDAKIDGLIRRANIAAKPSERAKIPDMMAKVREIREKGYGWAENVPFLGGAR